MILLAHRGWWTKPEEKNTRAAFDRALAAGHGIETDVRDGLGELYISHDMPKAGTQTFADFLEQKKKHANKAPVAINVKADGLHKALGAACAGLGREEYFLFDMAVPDTLGYLRAGMNVFVRDSEIESPERFLKEEKGVKGIWLDCFKRDWITAEHIKAYMAAGLDVALVSPELHNSERPYQAAWNEWKKAPRMLGQARLMLCTDFPDRAEAFFGKSNAVAA